MFQEEETQLLRQALVKVRRQYSNCNSVYQYSGFDEDFDEELKKIVLSYHFDFEAVALHLYFMFPQYGHRLKPQAVSYRWYQLVLEREGDQIKRDLEDCRRKTNIIGKQQEIEAESQEEPEEQEVVIVNWQEKLKQYETAIGRASLLDEEEEENFMLYKPKFIVDSEFKLQREPASNPCNLQKLVQNQILWEFGSFEAPQNNIEALAQPEKPLISFQSNKIENIEQQTYLDDDWEAYQSD